MDDYADELAEQLDEIAERLIAIGGDPISTTHEFIATTKLQMTRSSGTNSHNQNCSNVWITSTSI